MSADQGKALEFVQPLQVAFTIDGRDVVISPIVLRELPALLKLVEPVIDELLLVDDGLLSRLEAGTQTPLDLATVASFVAAHSERVIDALVLCSRQPADWVGGLLLDRVAELLVVCVRVNADFFTRAMPGLKALVSRAKPAGSAPAPSSTTATP